MMTDEQIKEALGNILGTLGEFGKRVDFVSAELYKSLTNREAQARLEMEYVYKLAGMPVP